jgi:imidazoleglycerol phosphate dehydratase HisB
MASISTLEYNGEESNWETKHKNYNEMIKYFDHLYSDFTRFKKVTFRIRFEDDFIYIFNGKINFKKDQK